MYPKKKLHDKKTSVPVQTIHREQLWVIVIVHTYIAAIQRHLKKTLAGLMNQLPCNSLSRVPGSLVQLIHNTVDKAQNAVNGGFHRPCVDTLRISSALIHQESNILSKHPHKGDSVGCARSEKPIYSILFLSVHVMLCLEVVDVKMCLIWGQPEQPDWTTFNAKPHLTWKVTQLLSEPSVHVFCHVTENKLCFLSSSVCFTVMKLLHCVQRCIS